MSASSVVLGAKLDAQRFNNQTEAHSALAVALNRWMWHW
jgi:hypothetical protein